MASTLNLLLKAVSHSKTPLALGTLWYCNGSLVTVYCTVRSLLTRPLLLTTKSLLQYLKNILPELMQQNMGHGFGKKCRRTNPQYHHSLLYHIDLKIEFLIPPKLPIQVEGVLYQLRHDVEFTNKYICTVDWLASPDCPACLVIDDIAHLLCCCELYNAPRACLRSTLGMPPDCNMSCANFLGLWRTLHATQQARTALVQFLRDLGLHARLLWCKQIVWYAW